MISPLFRIKNADTETGWNVQILRSVWIISAEIRYLLSEQKKFQNKSKNIDEVYQSVFFRCIMFLSYRVTFLCNVLGQIHYTSESPVRYFFYEKVVKWCLYYIIQFYLFLSFIHYDPFLLYLHRCSFNEHILKSFLSLPQSQSALTDVHSFLHPAMPEHLQQMNWLSLL